MNKIVDLSIYQKKIVLQNIDLFKPYITINIIKESQNDIILKFEKREDSLTYIKEFFNYLILLHNK